MRSNGANAGPVQRLAFVRSVVAARTAGKFRGRRGGRVVLDLFTASAIARVHDRLGEANRAKLLGLPLEEMGPFIWRLLERAGARA